MTCVVGISNGKQVVIGADGAGVAGTSIEYRQDKKVFERELPGGSMEHIVIGYAGSFRLGQHIRFKLEMPYLDKDEENLLAWLVVEFVPRLMALIEENKYTFKDGEMTNNDALLIGVRGQLFRIDCDLQVAQLVDNDGIVYAAIGCGSDVALGSLFATKGKALNVRVHEALKAAAYHDCAVSEPFTTIRL